MKAILAQAAVDQNLEELKNLLRSVRDNNPDLMYQVQSLFQTDMNNQQLAMTVQALPRELQFRFLQIICPCAALGIQMAYLSIHNEMEGTTDEG